MINRVLLCFLLSISIQNIYSQTTESEILMEHDGVVFSVTLDSVVIKANKEGLSIQHFIDKIQDDKTLYRAFKNLRKTSYRFHDAITFYDKKRKQIAYYQSTNRQDFLNGCRTMTILKDTFSGHYFEDGELKYYTAHLFDRLFNTNGKVCGFSDSEELLQKKSSKEIGYINNLKKLIFAPGTKTDVPIIGDKTAIFSKEMIDFYHFAVKSTTFLGQECYEFEIIAKEEKKIKESDTVIKTLSTYFSKKDNQVLGRNYQLKYQGVLFDFDVWMEIILTQKENMYIPLSVKYNGEWDIPLKKPEICSFWIKFEY